MFSGETATISSKSKIVATGTSLMNNLYKLDIEVQDGETQPDDIAFSATSNSQAESIHTSHQRLGHVTFKNLKKMQVSDMVQGLYVKKSRLKTICSAKVAFTANIIGSHFPQEDEPEQHESVV